MICCVTGHRPKGFPFPYGSACWENEEYTMLLEMVIRNLIYNGYSDFISGMAEGVDIDFAQAVLYLREEYEFVSLEAALPYPFVMPKNPTDKHFDKKEILCECDSVTVLSPHYSKGCMQNRNRYMVDKSDLVLAIWNGEKSGGTWDTIKYAQKQGKRIKYIMLKELGTDSSDIFEYINEDYKLKKLLNMLEKEC